MRTRPWEVCSEDSGVQCNFCELRQEGFADPAALDEHHTNHCPMLGPCKFCGEMVALWAMRQHCLKDCSKFPATAVYHEEDPKAQNARNETTYSAMHGSLRHSVLPDPRNCPLCGDRLGGNDLVCHAGRDYDVREARRALFPHLRRCTANQDRRWGVRNARGAGQDPSHLTGGSGRARVVVSRGRVETY